jgi:tetratricopeptide (TPR) repeat protein
MEVHELLRQYGQDRLEENPAESYSVKEEHATFFAVFMAQRWETLKGDGQLLALTEIEADIQNVRAAWQYDLARKNTPRLWKFIKGLWHLYWIRWWNHAGMELFAEAVRVLEVDEGDDETRAFVALAMVFQAYFMAWLDLSGQGYELARAGVEILEQHDLREALVFAYDSLTVNAYMQNRLAEEHVAIEKMVEIASGMGDEWLYAFALYALGLSALIREDFVEAKRLAELELHINAKIGDVVGSTLPLIVLGHQALARGEYGEAREYYLRCLDISQEVGFPYAIQTSTKYLGKVTLSLERIQEAELHLVESLRITKEIGFVRDIINLLYEFARLRAAQGLPEEAVELLGLVIQHPASYKTRLGEGRIRDSAKELLAKLEAEVPQGAYTAALARGQELDLEEVVVELLSTEAWGKEKD